MASEPRCTEVTVSASVGGKVQIVKFEYTADFHYSMTRKYDIPEDWAETDVLDFQHDKTVLLREQLEVAAQAEMDELMRQRDES
jgi:hypothetical protein